MKQKLSVACVLSGVCFFSGIEAQAANERLKTSTAIERALAQEIIGPDLALEEVRVFNETRVPDMPSVRSAAEWKAKAREYRRNVLNKVVFRGEAAKWRDTPLRVEWSAVIEGLPGYRIRKLRFEAVPGWWIPALLYEPTKLSGKRPVVLNVNGHDGKGKAADYKQIRCINQAKRGMIALNVEWIGMGQFASRMSHYQMNQMDLCGTAGIAPFFLNMSKGLDVLLSHPNADPKRVAVAGLSGGGWQTIFISSLDERVTLANPVAGYSSFKTRARHGMDLGDSEQTPNDLALYADYTHLTALLANRAALLTYNAKDNCCFTAGHALPPLLAAAQPIFRLLGRGEFLRSHINHDPGSHNFELDNRQQLYRFIGDVFYQGQEYDWQEIPSADEVKTYDELLVDLPEENGGFNSIALGLMETLPKPFEGDKRRRLLEVVSAKNYTAKAKRVRGEGAMVHFQFQVGDDWTLPGTVFTPDVPMATTLLIADAGRKAQAERVESRAGASWRSIRFSSASRKSRAVTFCMLSSCTPRASGRWAFKLAKSRRWLNGRKSNTSNRSSSCLQGRDSAWRRGSRRCRAMRSAR